MNADKAPSSSEEGVGGGEVSRLVLLERAARMRNNPTEPEKRLWRALRDSQLCAHKFRRQAVIGYRIVDFFCPSKGLIVEVDGETHDREEDERRDSALQQSTGFATLRFTNHEVMRQIDNCQLAILAVLNARPDRWSGLSSTTPGPSSEEEGSSGLPA